MNNNKHIRIADAAKMLSVSTKTLRRWEKKGKLIPSRSAGNQRYYDLEAIHNFKLSLENKLPIENSQNIQNKKDISSLKRKVFGFSVLTIVTGIVSFGIILGNEGIIGNKKENERKITQINNSKGAEGSVLATSTGLDDTTIGQKYTFNINVPSKFNEVVTFVKDITAPNIVNSLNSKTGDVTFNLTAGTGITVDGLKVTNSGVTSLTAGTGISVSGSTITSSDLGSSQNIFKTVAATGQTSVASDSNSDTLTLAGSGVVITTDAATDYLTFSSASVDFTNTGWTDGGTDVYATTISDYVGIGTNDPSYNLEVTGTGYFSDTLTLAGALSVSGATNLNGNVTFGNAITDAVTFTGRLAAGSTILPDTDLGSDLGSSGLRFNNLYVANIISNSSSTFSGQTTFTYAPLDATISQASVIINPTTAVANGQLIGFAVNSFEVGAVDKEGDLTLGYLGLASIPENSYPLSIYNHGTTQVAYIDTSGNIVLSGNIDINGTTNDIAGTLNLSGNALTSSGALTITPAAGNNLNIVTSGAGDVVVNTNQFVVDSSSGNVGIGTATPTSKLHVTGAVTGKALAILDETGDQNILVASASGATKFVIDHNGNVGIGMTSPSAKMDIEAVSGTDALRFTSSGTKILGISTGTNLARLDVNNTSTNLLTNGTFESNTTSWSGTQRYTLDDEFSDTYPTTLASGGVSNPIPSLGSDLWDAGAAAFTSGTYAWTAYGTNTIENDSNTLKITYVNFTQGAVDFFKDASDLSSNLTVGNWYQTSESAKVSAGNNVSLQYHDGNGATVVTFGTVTGTDFSTFTGTFRALSATEGYTRTSNMTTGEIIWLDDISLKPLTLSSLFSTVSVASSSDHTVQADVTLTSGTQAGVAVNMDSGSSPTRFVIAYHDGTNVKMDKNVAGTYTNLVSSAVAYVAGATIKVIQNGTSYAVFYNGSQVGTTQTVSASDVPVSTIHGVFSTYASNSFSNFYVYSGVNGTLATDGVNTRTVADTVSYSSVTGGSLTITGTVASFNPYIWYPAISRVSGKSLIVKTLTDSVGNQWEGFALTGSGAVSAGYGLGQVNGAYDQGASTGSQTIGSNRATAFVLRGTGAYFFLKDAAHTNWELIWVSSTGSQTSLYPAMGVQNSTSATATRDYIRVPSAVFVPTPLAYDTFTRGDGAIGSSETTGPDSQTTPSLSWTGGTISSNKNVITPTLGDELVSSGGNWVGDFDVQADVDSWTESGATKSLDGTAMRLTNTAGGSGYAYRSFTTVVGTKYYYSATFTGGSATNTHLRVGTTTTGNQYYECDHCSVGTYYGTFTATGTTSYVNLAVDSSSIGAYNVFDDVTIKPLTLSSLFSTVSTSDKDVIISTDVNGTWGPHAGVVTNLDSASSPTAGIIAYLKRTNATTGATVTLDKFTTATTWTNVLAATSVTYSAGATLRIVTYHSDANTLKVRVYYNGALVGTEQTVTDAAIISNTKHGLFSTYSGNTFDNFSLYARGSDGEYEQLTPTDLTVTHEVTTTLAGSSGSAKLVAPASYYNDFTQSVNVGGTGTYTLTAHAYTDGSAVTSSDLELYYNTGTITTTFTPLDAQSGWYKLTGTFTGVASSLPVGVRVKAGKTVYLDNVSVTSGTTTASTVHIANNTTGTANLNVLGLVDGTDGGIATLSKAGAVSDSDFVTDYDGLLGIDTTNHRLYFREGGSWSYIARTGGFQIPKEETEGLSIGDLVIPYVESTMSDGALHGMYKKYDDVIKNRSLDTLSVLGDSSLSDTLISGKLDIGKISFDGLSFSILGDENLKIQSSSLNGVDFLNGKLKISKDGLITVNSDITGSEILAANQNEIIVNKVWKTKPTTIITTPSFNTSVFVSDITENGFKIHTGNQSQKDEIINWVSIW